jgi:hypothetical protein
MITTGTLAYAQSVHDRLHAPAPRKPAEARSYRQPMPRKRRFFAAAEPTAFQRYLAVHMYFAQNPSALE